MELIQQKIAPPDMVSLIENEYKSIPTIEKVLIVGQTDQLNDRIAAFILDTNTVIIDMSACMEDMRWMKLGMAYVPNVWCNLIYCVFHEGAHARQYHEYGEGTFDIKRAILEHNADIEATEKMIDWFNINGQTPDTENLGWVGDRIYRLFNDVYSQSPDIIGTEIDLLGTEAGGSAELAARNPYFEKPEAVNSMMESLFRGDIGVKVKDKMYLRISDILEINALNHREHRVAMNGGT
jgi:hypothetical protein